MLVNELKGFCSSVVEDYVFQRYNGASLANGFQVFSRELSSFNLKGMEYEEKC